MLRKITDECYAFTGSVNIGYCTKEGKGLLIDTGLDESSIKKVLKQLEQEGLPLDYCVITHAHADHFGGGNYVKEVKQIPFYAPKIEKAIIENSILEPIYLFHGAVPIHHLRNKFLEGTPVNIDHVIEAGENRIGPFSFRVLDLPGHSYGQAGILFDDILYAADSYFGVSTLEKHIIPFITDADLTLSSLEQLLQLNCKGAIPGHGEYEENFHATVRKNLNVHKAMLSSLNEIVNKNQTNNFDNIMVEFLDLHNINVTNIGQWLLFRTSITAYLTSLERKKQLEFIISDNKLKVVPL